MDRRERSLAAICLTGHDVKLAAAAALGPLIRTGQKAVHHGAALA